MSRFRQVFVLLMVALWLPATLHCAVDQAELFESEPACCDEAQENEPENEACTEQCSVVAPGINKGSAENALVAVPLLVGLVAWLTPVELEPPTLPGLDKPLNAPPELARTWQFVARAALPPRAPSLLS